MGGETFKTRGVVTAIRPWSRTSHVVTWLTPDRGPVTTLVKGAVRPKSAFLGQYDLFYTCDVVCYERASGGLRALREVAAANARERLRGDWRAASLAGYAADLVSAHAPPTGESARWFDFLERTLDGLSGDLRSMVGFELGFLSLAGLSPDFSARDPEAEWQPFALDGGRIGEGGRTVRLSRGTIATLAGEDDRWPEAVRFLGLFLQHHLDVRADVRRSLVKMLGSGLAFPTDGGAGAPAPLHKEIDGVTHFAPGCAPAQGD